jgi:hypothetical protein
MSNTNGGKTGIRSLRDLRQDIQPGRDLWPAIAAGMSSDAQGAPRTERQRSTRFAPSGMQWAALAAVVAALAVGMWIGRTLLPMSDAAAPQHMASTGPESLIPAAYVSDPRYQKERAALVRTLEVKMKTLPPETQTRVAASLATIRKSIADIQAALGRDPANALLQELLVNSYQDEMRVLTTVHEAGNSGQEI